MRAIHAFGTTLLAAVLVTGCESKTPPAQEAPGDRQVNAQEPPGDRQAQVSRDNDAGADDTGVEEPHAPAVAVEPSPVALNFPLRTIPEPMKHLERKLRDGAPVGSVSGELFDGAELLAIVRAECGEGVTLQPIFRQKKKLRIATPIRLPLFSLATTDPVVIEDDIFTIESQFSDDSPGRLKGTLKITYDDGKNVGTFIDMSVDAKPLTTLYPPRLDGRSRLPSYGRCTPTGFAQIEADGRTFQGLIHADDVGGRGVPSVWIAMRPGDLFHLMVIPPEPKLKVENLGEPLDIMAAREKSSRPVVVLGKFIHTARITSDAEATSGNLDRPEEASLFDGKVTALRLVPEGKRWRLQMTLEQLMIPEMLESDLAGRKLDVVKIDTFLAPKDTFEPILPNAPRWWAGAENE